MRLPLLNREAVFCYFDKGCPLHTDATNMLLLVLTKVTLPFSFGEVIHYILGFLYFFTVYNLIDLTYQFLLLLTTTNFSV